MTPADLVEEVRKSSSKWIKTKGPEYASFYWQGCPALAYGRPTAFFALIDGLLLQGDALL